MSRARSIGLTIVVGLVAVGVVVAIVVNRDERSTGADKTFIVAGTVTLSGQPGLTAGQPCRGTGNNADLHDGATVVVYDGSDHRLGTGELIEGIGTAADGGIACVWRFYVSDVNANPSAYSVELTNRGKHRYDVSGIHGRVDLVVQAR